MSGSTYSASSGAFVDQLLDLDAAMATQMYRCNKNAKEIYHIYLDRLSLLEKSSLFPLTEKDKNLLNDKKEELYVALKLFILRKDMEKQLDEMLILLDDFKKLVN